MTVLQNIERFVVKITICMSGQPDISLLEPFMDKTSVAYLLEVL